MSSSVIGLIVFLYGVYQLYTNGVTQDLNGLKSLSMVVGGAGYGLYGNLSTIASYVKLPSFSKAKIEKNPADKCFSPEEFNTRDMDCLFHLKQRCVLAKSKEGIDTCAKLAAIIFSLDLPDNKSETVVK